MKMKQQLFNKKDIIKRCDTCLHGELAQDNRSIFCQKKGLKEPDDFCKKYKYDPLKRVPLKQIIDTDYSPEDFML
jgi:hypothetical protein